jgi:predicted nucleic acid-binding protein
MKKLKIYLDTSVISYLDQNDTPEKMQDTHILWEQIKKGLFDVYLSTITIEEIGDCKDLTKRRKLLYLLEEIKYTKLYTSDETENIARAIIDSKILTMKSYDDCLHIACAIIAECDIILSWNFKHLVNIKTIKGVRAITEIEGYKPIDIYTPTILISREEE